MSQKIRQLGAILGLVAVVFAAAEMGMFTPLSHMFSDLRFAMTSRPPTGDVVVADIDEASLDAVGAWPWPRSVYARLTDDLVAAGASDIAFDVDFSSPSRSKDDAAFSAALDRAGGFVVLAAFQQLTRNAEGILVKHFNTPIPELARNAWMGSVNVQPEPDGRVRKLLTRIDTPNGRIDSMSVILSGQGRPKASQILVDFSIDANRIDRIPVSSILDGTFDPKSVRGKKVIVGAGAVELRDNFAVPRFGTISGPVLQALAVDALSQHRILTDLGPWPSAILTLIFGLLVVLAAPGRSPLQIVLAAIGCSVGTEAGAVALQAAGYVVPTGGAQFALMVLLVGTLGRELGFGRNLLTRVTGQRDRVQGLLTRVIADNFDGIVVIDEDDTIITASRLAQQLLAEEEGHSLIGKQADQCLPHGMVRALHKARVDAAMVRIPDRNLHEMTVESRVGPARQVEFMVSLSDIAGHAGGHRHVACVTFRDVTERRQHEERLNYVASHDTLTGAMNRHRLVEQIKVLTGSTGASARGVTVILVDLARFKAINDSLGHSYGDEVLKQVVLRLRKCGPDMVARLGADSFALLSAEIMSAEALDAFCDAVLAEVGRPYQVAENRAIVGAAIGVTDSARSGIDPETLISHADMALSRAKQLRGRHYVVFEPEMDVALRERQSMETALRQAIGQDELVVLYQPQVDLATSRLVGVEALVRWDHPEKGLIPPGRFIGLAEETGLIIELGRWVLHTACREVAKWPEQVRLAVNVSPMQIEFGDVVGDVRDALRLSGLAPERLDIEITEDLLIGKPETVRRHLAALNALGVGVAMDDFGTGYSSLSYLDGLPIDKVKIDRSFVSSIPGSASSSAIVAAVLTLCQTLGKTVVAEGIENEDQAWLLKLGGCDIGQGYYFGRPLPAAEVIAAVEANAGNWSKVSVAV